MAADTSTSIIQRVVWCHQHSSRVPVAPAGALMMTDLRSFDLWLLQSCTKSLWRVEPAEGDISPWTQLELKVVAHLNDTLKFKDLLKVWVQHGQTHTIALSATGTGSPVMSDQPFAPSIDLGTHLRY